jgi:enamine deaminase RidA (YjgF/YER057c/UK114 family)
MKRIHSDSYLCPWPGYPAAVVAGGFCFLSSMMALDSDGQFISRWEDLPKEGVSLGSGFPAVDALTGPVGAQAWQAYRHAGSLMASLGGSLEDLLRVHIYQKDKRFFPVFEKVRMVCEPRAPAPSSGIGVCDSSPDGKAWIALDGIGMAPGGWKFQNRRSVLRSSGSLPETSYFSQGIEGGPYIFLAGQIPIETAKPGKPAVKNFEDVPEEGRFLQVGRSHTDSRNGPIAAQSWFIYDHIRRILKGTDSSMKEIVNVTVFLQDMNDFPTFHDVHRHFFPVSPPALTVTEFKEVGHKGSLIEIEVTAMRPLEKLDRRSIAESGSLKSVCHCPLAVIAGPLVFISGQAGVDERGEAIQDLADLPAELRGHAAAISRVTGRPGAVFQAVRIFENLKAVLSGAGASLESIARIALYLEDFRDFMAFDVVCRHYFRGEKPSLACVTIPRVHPVPGTRMAIEAIAVRE